MKILVTGGAGFIGSHLVDKLLELGYDVYVIDNLSSGRLENIKYCLSSRNCFFEKCDLKEPNCLERFNSVNIDLIIHLAANPDVKASYYDPETNYNENIYVSFRVLEFARKKGVKRFFFASSSTVYGDAEKIPTPEDHSIKPISIYGACKAAVEVLTISYSNSYKIKSLILRLANIIGPRSTHGVIYDFIRKLSRTPDTLEILGDGSQRKSYLYISDTVDAIIKLIGYIDDMEYLYDVFNIGNEDWITVNEIADVVIETMRLGNVKKIYRPATLDGRGWIGDVKFMLLDISKIKKRIGWKPSMNSRRAVEETAKYLIEETVKTRSEDS